MIQLVSVLNTLIELGWKLLQRWIKLNVGPEEAEPRTKKDLFRLAAKKID